jgi:hypothetical protein
MRTNFTRNAWIREALVRHHRREKVSQELKGSHQNRKAACILGQMGSLSDCAKIGKTNWREFLVTLEEKKGVPSSKPSLFDS